MGKEAQSDAQRLMSKVHGIIRSDLSISVSLYLSIYLSISVSTCVYICISLQAIFKSRKNNK